MSTATCEPLVQEHDASGHTGSMQLVSFKLGERDLRDRDHQDPGDHPGR